jgi:hypothetical protein
MPQFLKFLRVLLAFKVKGLLREIRCINFRKSLQVSLTGKSFRRRSFLKRARTMQ